MNYSGNGVVQVDVQEARLNYLVDIGYLFSCHYDHTNLEMIWDGGSFIWRLEQSWVWKEDSEYQTDETTRILVAEIHIHKTIFISSELALTSSLPPRSGSYQELPKMQSSCHNSCASIAFYLSPLTPLEWSVFWLVSRSILRFSACETTKLSHITFHRQHTAITHIQSAWGFSNCQPG